MKKAKALLIAATALALMLTGCGGSGAAGSSAEKENAPAVKEEAAAPVEEEKGEPTEALLVLYGDESQRMREFAENEFHDKVLEAINVDVTIQYLPWSEYAGGKTELMLSSGEKFTTYTDVSYLAKCISKGYYADLTDAVEKYAGNIKTYCGGEAAFNDWTIDGRVYAIPMGNNPNAGENYVVCARRDIMDEVGMEILSSVEDVEKFYQLAKEKYPDIVGMARGGMNLLNLNAAIESDVNVLRLDGFVMTDGNKPDDDTVYSFYESEEYRQMCEITKRWNEMGIIPSYLLSNGSQADAEFVNGNGLLGSGTNNTVFEFMDLVRTTTPDAVFENFYLGDMERKPLMSRGTYTTAFAVSANVEGEELEGYVKLIDLLQSSQEWVDFITFGVLDKDYTLNEEGQVERLIQENLIDTWMPNNINFKRYPEYATEKQIETFKNWDEGSIMQKNIGFAFDPSAVSTELAQLQAVESEYLSPISSGFVDYEVDLPAAIEKLKAAGLDKYVAEYQRQFSEFMAKKNGE